MRRPLHAILFLLAAFQTTVQADPGGFLRRLLPGFTREESQPAQTRKPAEAPNGTIPIPEAFFSPKGGCTQAVLRELNAARQSVLVQAYSFTSAPIAAALVEAARRGVLVEVVLDKSNKTGKYSSADFVAHAGIPTWLDEKHAIAHNKVMVIDEATVITGSFNFTKAAEENNAENLLILRSSELAARYTRQFIEHRQHSARYLMR
jgi:phosphatidylserine/phosphatidylglycerophosphate/cardiolipin synthase-like enzyme